MTGTGMKTGILTLDVRPGERLLIGGELVQLELLRKSGQQARIRVSAPTDVKIELIRNDVPMMR